MSAQQESTVLEPSRVEPRTAPLWNVILLDDDEHTYEYVIEMVCKLFNRDAEAAFRAAVEVDRTGRVILETTTLERAELKREQIHAYGPDPRVARCRGSMRATLEPALG